MKEYVLEEDFVIPKGTVFKNIDGEKREWANGNYEATLGKTRGTTQSLIVCSDFFKGKK
ncbi:MAG: hypothetical protein GY679_01375 [Mycoplasma sp.]|nr:hypothetical protein [Mycoplasma sp.]